MLKCCLLLWRLAGYNQENPELDIFKFWLIQFVIAFSVMLFITASRLSIGRALKTEEALSISSAMYPRWLTQSLVWENKPEFKSLFGNAEQELWMFYSVHIPTINICGEAIYFTFLSLSLLLCETETTVISVSWPDTLWLKSLHLALHSFIPQICIHSKVLQKYGRMNHLWSFCFLYQALCCALGVMMKVNMAQSLFSRKFSVKWMRRTGMRLYDGEWHIREQQEQHVPSGDILLPELVSGKKSFHLTSQRYTFQRQIEATMRYFTFTYLFTALRLQITSVDPSQCWDSSKGIRSFCLSGFLPANPKSQMQLLAHPFHINCQPLSPEHSALLLQRSPLSNLVHADQWPNSERTRIQVFHIPLWTED